MYYLNKGNAGFDRKYNEQVWGMYNLPFGRGQSFVNHGVLAEIIGGFVLNGQFSHTSGAPFTVNSNSNVVGAITPGFNTTYAQLVSPYKQEGGHNRKPGDSTVSGGKPWFDPASFANVTEPAYTATMSQSSITAPVLPNTGRNQFRGPGQSLFNASVFRSIHLYRESEFQIRFEAFNLFNHPILNTPSNVTVGGSNFGYLTSFGNTRSLQFGGRLRF